MTRKIMIAGNWKMNHGIEAAIKFLTELQRRIAVKDENIEVVICPPYTALYPMSVALQDQRDIALGAQNCYFEDAGAYTGEISSDFLAELSCEYVIIGHSERRHIFGETDEQINKKIKKVCEKGMTPIFCVGETELQREKHQTFDVLSTQLIKGLGGITKDLAPEIVIAYEPVWAIGTGKTATPEQAQEAHDFIRKEIAKTFGSSYAAQIRILYGGSVKPDNIRTLLSKEDIDGALVGGASLEAQSFSDLILRSK